MSTADVKITSKDDLKRAYLPFIKQRGLLIDTDQEFSFGDEITVNLTLMEERDQLTFTGKVVWYIPKSTGQTGLSSIGLQFNESDSSSLCKKIETYLAGSLG